MPIFLERIINFQPALRADGSHEGQSDASRVAFFVLVRWCGGFVVKWFENSVGIERLHSVVGNAEALCVTLLPSPLWTKAFFSRFESIMRASVGSMTGTKGAFQCFSTLIFREA